MPRWDVYCRVVDNFGDIGVAWRLACDLARRGVAVRLWIDDASALAWMAPAGTPGVDVRRWADAEAGADADTAASPASVVVETFGCGVPDGVLARLAAASPPPAWIDLEYLSAEAYVERSHGLPSPQSRGPGAGLVRRFYFPGFTASTGGLIREPDLLSRQRAFDRRAWLEGVVGRREVESERIVSLYCYEAPSLPSLLERLQPEPTLLLATAGAAARQVGETLGAGLRRGNLRAVVLPFLSQIDYDHLLWASDLNVVRGEDSFVRAQWAARPFVWQPYPQHDGAHHVKLDAFLDRFDPGAAVASLWRAWNAGRPLPPLPEAAAWRRHCEGWRDALLRQRDLTTQLLDFATAES